MKKLDAFTIMEAIIAMVVTGVVIAFASMGWMMFLDYYHGVRSRYETASAASLLHAALAGDFFHAETVRYGNDEVIFTKQEKNTVYRFSAGYLTRIKEEVTDTFHLEPTEITTGMNQQPLVSPGGMIDELNFTITVSGMKEKFYFHKEYGSDVRMQSDSLMQNTPLPWQK